MANTIINEYQPDYIPPPGETLEEVLEKREMTQVELANKIGYSEETIKEIIQGKGQITPEISLQLEKVLGISADFWDNREKTYREFLAKQEFEKINKQEKQISFLEDAKEFIGCVDGGLGDLATNKKYLQRLGQE